MVVVVVVVVVVMVVVGWGVGLAVAMPRCWRARWTLPRGNRLSAA